MRGAATKSMSDIVEERQQRRYAPFAAAPLRAAAPKSFLAQNRGSTGISDRMESPRYGEVEHGFQAGLGFDDPWDRIYQTGDRRRVPLDPSGDHHAQVGLPLQFDGVHRILRPKVHLKIQLDHFSPIREPGARMSQAADIALRHGEIFRPEGSFGKNGVYLFRYLFQLPAQS